MKYQVREKIFRLGEDNDILNEAGQPVLQVDGKVFSLHGLMVVNDLAGTEVGQVSRKLVSLLATYEIALTRRGQRRGASTVLGAVPSQVDHLGGRRRRHGDDRKLCRARFRAHREWSYRRDRVQGVDQPRRLLRCRHRRRARTISSSCAACWRSRPSRIGARSTTAAKVSSVSSEGSADWREAVGSATY